MNTLDEPDGSGRAVDENRVCLGLVAGEAAAEVVEPKDAMEVAGPARSASWAFRGLSRPMAVSTGLPPTVP
jgi:hypothetical protein